MTKTFKVEIQGRGGAGGILAEFALHFGENLLEAKLLVPGPREEINRIPTSICSSS